MSFIHGHARDHGRSKVYECWRSMTKRCRNKKDKDYGGRGITVSKRWMSFNNFLNDMGDKPNGMSLERINNNLGYFPSNCKWATNYEQNRNNRRTVLITFRGQTKCRTDWEREIGLKTSGLLYRFRRGWSIEKALTTPNMRKQ